ncbi:hypothetical protein I316_06050 [Kwoniella heveanensis BCC8398]|uniref:Uncharacterized protein n=1 Tax=Kwoniella heveanensis BCC8398 TaxID=1296120 RepID=A0A1B9GMU5_9TREE|nr:hypothetical protein I316_06050 [Kwoniella heveanensis BCC8398]
METGTATDTLVKLQDEEESIEDEIRYEGEHALSQQPPPLLPSRSTPPVQLPEPIASGSPPAPSSYDLRRRPRKRERYSPGQSPPPRPQLAALNAHNEEQNADGSSPLTSLPPSPAPSSIPSRASQDASANANNLRKRIGSSKKRKRSLSDCEFYDDYDSDGAEADEEVKPKMTKLSRPKKTYSSWSCAKVPSNIMDILRFDHPPEIIDAPRPVLPDLPADMVYQQQSHRSRREARPHATPAKVSPQARAKPKIKIKVVAEHAPRSSALEKSIQKAGGDGETGIEIVPLPDELSLYVDGILSSKFCAVLRILAGLPKPSPKRAKQVLPKPTVDPPVWAESRQELCEALPYYRSFQSGLYMHARVAFGYLLEAYPAPRDIWAHNGKVVISHGGGQCIRTIDARGSPGVSLQADQSRSDARVDTLLNAYEKRTPIVLIAGAGYDDLPWQLDCAYVVLGWYYISMTWVEAEPAMPDMRPPSGRNYFHRYKIRFDWVQSQGEPWWWHQGSDRQITSKTSSPSTSEGGVGSHPSEPVTPPRERCPGSSPADPWSPERDIVALLNPAGLLTPPLSSPSGSEVAAKCDQKGSALSQENIAASGESFTVPDEGLHVCRLPRTVVSNAPQPCNQTSLCPTCNRPIPQVYQEGSICLQSDCPAFFMLPTSGGLMPIPPGFSLSYVEDFLRPVVTPSDVRIPYGVVPPQPVRTIPETGETHQGSGAGSRTLWRGWVCGNCGRANSRYRWEVWECRNCGNRFAHLDPDHIIPARSLVASTRAFLGDAKIDSASGISVIVRRMDDIKATVCVYDLAQAGQVYHVLNSRLENMDELFEEYQREAARGGWFQRRPIKANTAQHFAVNSGASYKYIVDTMSFSFDDSPPCVMKALDL